MEKECRDGDLSKTRSKTNGAAQEENKVKMEEENREQTKQDSKKASNSTNCVSFEVPQKNESLEGSRERSGSNGSAKSPGSSNGSSKKVVVVRSAPITIGKIEKKRADSPRSPPVVPPIPEHEEEELSDFVCASGSKKEERMSFIKKLRRSSLTFRESLRRRLSTQSIEDMKVHGREGRGEKDRRSSTPPLIEWDPVVRPTMARRQSTIGVITDSEFHTGRMERFSSGDRIGVRTIKTVRRGSITEEARAGCSRPGRGQGKGCSTNRATYWKLPGVQEDKA